MLQRLHTAVALSDDSIAVHSKDIWLGAPFLHAHDARFIAYNPAAFEGGVADGADIVVWTVNRHEGVVFSECRDDKNRNVGHLRSHLLERNMHVAKPQGFCGYQHARCGHGGRRCGEPHFIKVLKIQKTFHADDILKGVNDFFDGTGRWGKKAVGLRLRSLWFIRCHLTASWVMGPYEGCGDLQKSWELRG